MSDEAKKDEREVAKNEPEDFEAHRSKNVNDEATDEADDDVEAHVSKSMPSKSMPSKS